MLHTKEEEKLRMEEYVYRQMNICKERRKIMIIVSPFLITDHNDSKRLRNDD